MKFVCKECFSDTEIIGFIISQREINQCDFCKTLDVDVVRVDELYGFFAELFTNLVPKEHGTSLSKLLQGDWSFFKNQTCADKVLNYVIQNIDTNFIRASDGADYIDEIYENINYWEQLKEQLKWEKRYFTDINYLTEDLGWDSFFQSQVVISPSDIFYRARLHQKEGQDPFNETEMLCPPKYLTTSGRANPIGIPYLYLSDNLSTTLYEVRATFLDEVTVAKFQLDSTVTTRVAIADFTETPSLDHPNEINKKIKGTLLRQKISLDLSQPMRRFDSDLDYIPTQFICEFIKVFTGVDGIKFASSLDSTGNNLVIFNQEIMVCTSVEKVRITKLKISHGR
ncbi:RES family NAD+ phosphorylase [Providencia rettgeri]